MNWETFQEQKIQVEGCGHNVPDRGHPGHEKVRC